jgi:hypothetical protein
MAVLPHGKPIPQRVSTKMLSIMGARKSHASTSRTQAPLKTTESKAFPRIWRGKVTKKRRIRSSCVTPTTNPTKKHHQNLPTKFNQKGSENHQKRKYGSTSKSQRNKWMNSKPSIHHEDRFFTKRLATSHHPTHLRFAIEH